ncbi:alpha/beta-hydrolase [Plenodomus tracheiphilus IPT5]|uniref:Alpha/beta-hydrolase n=1 Tax=Plenodomus tracheiphilus IPT5 TaxID=1408161 RepID=A0A6A7AZ44_9PLEO|nr:alpha/beta-hydrolase [Plenodomus tracheiphilus IPT5]
MRSGLQSLALLSVLPLAFAAPAPAPAPLPQALAPQDATSIRERQLAGGLVNGVAGAVDGLLGDINAAVAAGNPTAVLSALGNIQPTTRPTNIPDVLAKQSAIWASPTTRTDFFAAIATQVANGLVLDDTLNTVLTGGLPVGENSVNNDNPPPPTTIYPKKEEADAPYTLSESALRQALFIPKGFTYGAKPPVLFIPGTGSYGGSCFGSNLRKLLTGQDYADPVWLNIPGALLGDAQTNSEYVAYAIHYLSSVSNDSRISIISWSQGGLDTQWVLKFWPSTRKLVRSFLPVSPDFKGSVLANVLCLSLDSKIGLNPLCAPSVIQQQSTSQYIAALRRDGGDSAYVPTTTFYSGFFDEIVEPQQGTIASAFMRDARRVGVSNNEVQRVCAGQAGGSFYGHAGVLFNPLTYALVVDALTHEDGMGDLSRIDVKSVCGGYAAEGLGLDDVLATSGLIPVAAVLLVTFPERRSTEPVLRGYVG